MKVTVFSTTTCPYCKMLKDYLSQHSIAFKEKLVDQDDQAREQMMKESGGFLGVPFVLVEKNKQKETIVGFDKTKINQLLGLNSETK